LHKQSRGEESCEESKNDPWEGVNVKVARSNRFGEKLERILDWPSVLLAGKGQNNSWVSKQGLNLDSIGQNVLIWDH